MPSARKAEEQRPFIDLRSPTEGGRGHRGKEGKHPSQHDATLGGHAGCPPRSQVCQRMADQRTLRPAAGQADTNGRDAQGEKSFLHQQFSTMLRWEQQRRGPNKPRGTNGLSRPRHVPRTQKAAPPLSQLKTDAAKAQKGSLNFEGEISPTQEGEAVTLTSSEEGGPLTPPEELPLPPGVERATRGGYA